jgi:hypothetical protein
MGDMLKTDGPLIEPVYSQGEPSATVDLGAASVEFAFASKTYTEQARVSMRFVPDDRLLFIVPTNDSPPLEEKLKGLASGLDDWDGKLKLLDRNVTLDAFCIDRGGFSSAFTFTPRTSSVTVTPAADALGECVFHLFNFPDFFGPEDYAITTGEPPRTGWMRCGRVVLKADGWTITIAGTDKTRNQCKALHGKGGFVITHMGRIERDDQLTFSSEQLEDLLSCLHRFLSFALGRWAGVALPIGFDQAAKRVFEQSGMPMAASGPWNGSLSWFDSQHSELLIGAFPGFMVLWKHQTWGQPIRKAVYWYMRANEGGTGLGVDTGLTLSQVALEHLAWTYCVRDRKMVSAAAFGRRGLSAADRLRLLLSALEVPATIPDSLRALGAKPGQPWDDGPDAITGIRNALVHPRENIKLPHNSYYEAWQLSMWFLDMTLLRLCRYNGRYANRLRQRHAGDVEPVPWAQGALTDQAGE